MRGGLTQLVCPGTPVSWVDLEATRAQREQLHEAVRLRRHLERLLGSTDPSDERLRVTPYQLVEGEAQVDSEPSAS